MGLENLINGEVHKEVYVHQSLLSLTLLDVDMANERQSFSASWCVYIMSRVDSCFYCFHCQWDTFWKPMFSCFNMTRLGNTK